MKLLLIEDRIKRLEQFTIFDIKVCPAIKLVTGADFETLASSLTAGSTSGLESFGCIAAHRSALTNEMRDTLKEYCRQKKKHLVLFSGGISSGVFKDLSFPYLSINSRDFYSANLQLYISNMEQENESNLLMLQFGKNWKLSLLLNLRNQIAVSQNKEALKKARPAAEITEAELIKRLSDLKINELIRQDLMNENTREILSGNPFAPVTPGQVSEIKYAITYRINEML